MKSKADEILNFFERICAIPHTSGNEGELRKFLIDFFEEQGGFRSEVDGYGNLKVSRLNSSSDSKKIILQAHLDMVPQALDKDFDFYKQGIKTEILGNKLKSALGTTLGADNGIGVAAGVIALLDEELKNYDLTLICTVEEEIGLNGAVNLSQEFLANADYLLNLDSEDWGELFVGCAGGVRTDSTIPIKRKKNENKFDYKITLSNLKGGHSGCDIHLPRANAIIEALKFAKLCDLEIADIQGGTLDNAIPRECVIVASSNYDINYFEQISAQFKSDFLKKFSEDYEMDLSIAPSEVRNELVWENSAQIIENLISVPNGVLKKSDELGVVVSSSNFAIINSDGDVLKVNSSQRSLYNSERDALQSKIAEHLKLISGVSVARSAYPAWEMKENSILSSQAQELYRQMFKQEATIKVIHAGLECGLFTEKFPGLDMISFGPTLRGVHAPGERLDLASLDKFVALLVDLVKNYK